MKGSLYVLYSFLTNGPAPQTFIGAYWITALLRIAPGPLKRSLALHILALSPHYFYLGNSENPENKDLSHRQFLESEIERNTKDRERIYREILAGFLGPEDVVLDYGCGPGFLARAAAPHVKQVYALDISRGAIECAKILNSADNITYIYGLSDEKDTIKDSSVDAVYSFAVIQHVTDEILSDILAFCLRKLKPGGKLIFQVQLEDKAWRSEEEWKNDRSLKGRIRYSQGLHGFSRTAESLTETTAAAGFQNVEIKNISEMVSGNFDDICRTHLLLAKKP
jgi:2-polyprenyl-3-methyl-5-hydroxy-6-metoxy-1,4-benzoquinol methylase